MKATLVLLLATLAAANAMENFFWLGDYADEMGQLGKGCCLPTQWEGRVGAVHITKKFLRPKVRASDSKIGLDFANQVVAARSMFYCAKAKKVFETRTIADFKAQKAYFIFKDKCKTFSLRKPLVKPCIPDTFRKFPSYFYGASTSSLNVSPFGFRNATRASTLEVFSVVTRDSCVPIKGAFRVKRGRQSSMGTYQYFNITLGNTDKDLYVVPASCNSRNATQPETRTLWRKFKKLVGYPTEKPFNPDSQLSALAETDALTQVMDLIDSNALMMEEVAELHDHRAGAGRDRWYQRARHAATRRSRSEDD